MDGHGITKMGKGNSWNKAMDKTTRMVNEQIGVKHLRNTRLEDMKPTGILISKATFVTNAKEEI